MTITAAEYNNFVQQMTAQTLKQYGGVNVDMLKDAVHSAYVIVADIMDKSELFRYWNTMTTSCYWNMARRNTRHRIIEELNSSEITDRSSARNPVPPYVCAILKEAINALPEHAKKLVQYTLEDGTEDVREWFLKNISPSPYHRRQAITAIREMLVRL